jgi:hypothetical protein
MASSVTIRARYSCQGCGLADVGVDVPAREDEDVCVWMNATVQKLAADHRRRSPRCRANAFQEVKIPITGADRVGGPSIQ